ncbi:unnamed protein product [Brassica oleracea]
MNLMNYPKNSPTSSLTSSPTNLKNPTSSPANLKNLTNSLTNMKNSTNFDEPNKISHERALNVIFDDRNVQRGSKGFVLSGEEGIIYQRYLLHCVFGGDEETPDI